MAEVRPAFAAGAVAGVTVFAALLVADFLAAWMGTALLGYAAAGGLVFLVVAFAPWRAWLGR